MRFAQIPLIGFVLVHYVLANTESMIVELHGVTDGLIVSGTPWQGQFDEWPNNASSSRISLQGSAGKYFVRVCWPASEPADFDLQWEEPYVILSAARNVVPLKPVDPVVRYSLIASRIVYGLPEDAWKITQRIAMVIVLASVIAALAWRGVFVI